MIREMVRREAEPDLFGRLHGHFIRHFGMAVGFAWMVSAAAATQAPWTRNLRGLIDPTARPESTLGYLFGLPLLLTVGWFTAAIGQDLFRRTSMLRHPAIEFGVAGAAVFAVFVMAVHRAVAAVMVGL